MAWFARAEAGRAGACGKVKDNNRMLLMLMLNLLQVLIEAIVVFIGFAPSEALHPNARVTRHFTTTLPGRLIMF